MRRLTREAKEVWVEWTRTTSFKCSSRVVTVVRVVTVADAVAAVIPLDSVSTSDRASAPPTLDVN